MSTRYIKQDKYPTAHLSNEQGRPLCGVGKPDVVYINVSGWVDKVCRNCTTTKRLGETKAKELRGAYEKVRLQPVSGPRWHIYNTYKQNSKEEL
jgi:hypothetical protein